MNWDLLQVVASLSGPNSLNGDGSGSLLGALLNARNSMPEVFEVGLVEKLVRALLVSSLNFPNGEKGFIMAHGSLELTTLCPTVGCVGLILKLLARTHHNRVSYLRNLVGAVTKGLLLILEHF